MMPQKNARNNDLKSLFLVGIILVFAALIVSIIIIGNFSSPLDGAPDIFLWEYNGYSLTKHLEFTPLPHIKLVNNDTFYPYGVNSVLRPWGFERDYFYAILYLLFGTGPWLQTYYLLSLLIAVVGIYLLLYKDYGIKKASIIALLMVFANFYAIKLYPTQMCYSILHWSALSIVADFLLVKRSLLKQSISLRFILFRISLLFLILGLDLGYFAGYVLMVFVISATFVIIMTLIAVMQRKLDPVRLLHRAKLTYHEEIRKHPYQIILLTAICTLAAGFYFPMALQVAKTARSFDFSQGYNNGFWWSNPLRVIFPYFPGFDLVKIPMEKILHDRTVSAQVDGRPGLFWIFLGIIGFLQAGSRRLVYVPILIVLFFCLSYHPQDFPSMKLFPWFAFNRVASRSTAIYPLILGLLALEIDIKKFRLNRRVWLFSGLVLLIIIELGVAYSMPTFDRKYPAYSFPNKVELFDYMNYIRQQPGEAVLDWPFCIVGGNGIGVGHNLCPYFGQNAGVFNLQRFHRKKVVGDYLGRLHMSQIEPFIKAGWYKMFAPGEGDSFTRKQSRCFYKNEWKFFTDFYRLNDFAGINLYLDLLPESCANEFYRRFGAPQKETILPGFIGRSVFIPKSTGWRSQVDREAALELTYPHISDLDLMSNGSLSRLTQEERQVKLEKLSKINRHRGENHLAVIDLPKTWRWGFNAESTISLVLSQAQNLNLTFEIINPLPEQSVTLSINGTEVGEFSDLKLGDRLQKTLHFDGIRGVNYISFKYSNSELLNAPSLLKSDLVAVVFSQLAISASD